MKIAYCPICDDVIIIDTPEWIISCPHCNHHLNLRLFEEDVEVYN